MKDIAFWLVIGTLAGGAITAFVPDDLLVGTISNSYLQMLLVLVIAVPLYVCATGSIPVAAALVMKGMPVGAAIVFLIAGPATNVATLTVFTKVLGRRTVGVYLGTIITMSFLFGILFNYVFPDVKLAPLGTGHNHGAHGESVHWWEWASTAFLGLLILRIFVKQIWRKLRSSHSGAATPLESKVEAFVIEVGGMHCSHCQGSVRQALLSVTGVGKVEVSLEEGKAFVKGINLKEQGLISAVASAGYNAIMLHN